VVVDRHCERPLGLFLRDDVVVQDGVDVPRTREVVEVELSRGRQLLVDDLVTEIDALVANVDAGAGDQLLTCRWLFPQKLQRSCSFPSLARAISVSLYLGPAFSSTGER
jgi:hypothetical protein